MFAKLGDSISQSPAFLQGLGCAGWRPGRYRALRSTVRYFSARALPGESADCAAVNSFSRASVATLAFMPSGWALDPGGSQDPTCEADETPLGCEVRIDRPGYAVVLFGTNDVTAGLRIWHVDTLPEFTASMLGIVAALRDLGVVPILSTLPPRTDDPTAEAWTERFNAALYRLARDRRVPVINLWRALEGLPDQGLSADGLHPSTYDGPSCTGYCDPGSCAAACQAANFSPAGLRYGYDVRNLATLETLARLRDLAASLKPPVRSPRGAGERRQLTARIRRRWAKGGCDARKRDPADRMSGRIAETDRFAL